MPKQTSSASTATDGNQDSLPDKLLQLKSPLVCEPIYLIGKQAKRVFNYIEISLDKNFNNAIEARFGKVSFILSSSYSKEIESISEEGFCSIAVSHDGMHLLAAKKKDKEWVSSIASPLGAIFSDFGDYFSDSYGMNLTPAREVDANNLLFLYGCAGVRPEKVISGAYYENSAKILGTTIMCQPLDSIQTKFFTQKYLQQN
ncbi:hypothetical protein QX249_11080 [Vibrio parahaemolyticus]|uniref:Uncharacterized protein n=1 Tax=Vibrio parahaemolyticus TaxID=670 RepID=A0AAW8PYV2_VIBPH|nr:hypothetical protein [Vibrio parahaemolyticus]MDS1821206.1 hypothetical protein [Vibrio parahaemolyticus]